MCSVHELMRTLRALDAGKETKAIRDCMKAMHEAQRQLRERVAHTPIRRRKRGDGRCGDGVWVSLTTLGNSESPVFMPLDVPFTVWERSTVCAGVEMNEYKLVYVSDYEVPSWVHDSEELACAFERWCAGAPAEMSAALGDAALANNTMRRSLRHGDVELNARHFLCAMLRTPKCREVCMNGCVENVPVEAKPQYVWCTPKRNLQYHFLQDGTRVYPFSMSNWLKIDRKGDVWEPYPLVLPPQHVVWKTPATPASRVLVQ